MRSMKYLIPVAILVASFGPIAASGASTLTTQTITFTDKVIVPGTGAKYILAATGGASGNPVIFTVDPSTSANCSFNSTTGEVTFNIPAGDSCIIDANQAGNATYAAAAQVQQTFSAGLLPQTVRFTSAVKVLKVGTKYQLTTTKGGSGSPVIFTIDSSSTSGCTVGRTTGLITVKNPPGICAIDASETGGKGYLASGVTSEDFTVVSNTSKLVPTNKAITVTYTGSSLALNADARSQLDALAAVIKTGGLKSVSFEGFYNQAGSSESAYVASKRIATAVEAFLKSRLAVLKATGVKFVVTGDGAAMFTANPETSVANRRVVVIAS